MKKLALWVLIYAVLLSLSSPPVVTGRPRVEFDPDHPEPVFLATASLPYCVGGHNVGKLELAVNNNGTFGEAYSISLTPVDCFTGYQVNYCAFPKGSPTRYLHNGAFWIGAVVGRDTMVSVGGDGWSYCGEFHPPESPFGDMIYRSIIDPGKPAFANAVSEQDYIALYTDTFTSGVHGLCNDFTDGRPHRPLDIEITQRSYAWSYPYAEDFVLFDYSIKNIGLEELRQVYMGIYVDADVHEIGRQESVYDDICGFLYSYANPYGGCQFEDTVFIAWIADNDGDFTPSGEFNEPVPHITATRIVRTPADELEVSFNWWVSNSTPSLDFGPRSKSGDFRDLGTGGLGTPEGDRNKYAFLRNREFDYDQIFTAAIAPSDPFWLYPTQTIAPDISDGFDTRYLISFGPFNIDPGQTLPISFAYLAGENFHSLEQRDNARKNLEENYNPNAYYVNLNFDDLSLNAMWASWVYDNPGIDSDNDKYFGEYRLCCTDSTLVYDTLATEPNLIIDTYYVYDRCDTFWYKGDGVPDFRGAAPPPSPASWDALKVIPEIGRLTVRWNGLLSETTRDIFSREYDFEGYRVYLARDNRESSYTLLASYDIEDYSRREYNPVSGEWELNDPPFTLAELRCLYGDSTFGDPCADTLFDPARYPRNAPLTITDDEGYTSLVYFEPQDFNRSILANYEHANTGIRKVYPAQPYPTSLNPDSADISELTADGYFKYFEYEYTVENLLATVPYYVNVTAFDFGSPQSGLGSLETSKTVLSLQAFPLSSAAEIEAEQLEVYVYPNPYRINGRYIEDGFEGRDADYYIPDRMRRLNFANLPAKCTIRIYTLDGDLVREIIHDQTPDDPTAMHDSWDLITRNTQRIVTGIYYWVVEDDQGNTQVGKFVIIM
ncbi:MAG: hypothetical protein ACOYVF_04170 [Candidatus Zixiibacteriota bacterium]